MLRLDVRETPKKWYEWILYPIQMLLAVFVATVLIANICGTPISTALIGAAIGTIIYELFTRFKSPMFISSCGATSSAIIGAIIMGSGYTRAQYEGLSYVDKLAVPHNYVAVLVGGAVILAVYLIIAMIIKLGGKKYFDKIFPPTIVGAVTIVIGLNLASFIPGYVNMSEAVPNADNVIPFVKFVPLLVALFTMTVTAIVSHFGKGFWKTIGFLVGLLSGYILAIILETTGAYPTVLNEEGNAVVSGFGIIYQLTHWKSFNFKDFAFMNLTSQYTWTNFLDTLILFLPVAICAALEHYSDHKVLSNIIGKDLTQDPGLDTTLIGDGIASAVGTAIGGLPNTSYGESIATIGFSKVASVWMTLIAAILLGIMGFIPPVTAFIQSIPSCVFGGCAIILYGYIAASGLKTLIQNKVDLDDNKNLIVVSVILTVGVSGIFLFTNSFAGVSLAMVLGVLLNLLFSIKKRQKAKRQ